MSHWYDSTAKKSRRKRDSNPGSSALEADALPLSQRGGCVAAESLSNRHTTTNLCGNWDVKQPPPPPPTTTNLSVVAGMLSNQQQQQISVAAGTLSKHQSTTTPPTTTTNPSVAAWTLSNQPTNKKSFCGSWDLKQPTKNNKKCLWQLGP